MSLNCLREKLQHRFEAKQFSVNDSSSSLCLVDKVPEQIHPEIDQNKGEGNKQQSSYRVFARGADATVVFDSVTGFNAKAIVVMLMQLMQCGGDSMLAPRWQL